MKRHLIAATAAVAAALLAACGGGAHTAPLPAAGVTPAQQQKATLTVRLNVPTTTSSSSKRVPKYISPATTQITIDVQQGGSSIAGFPQTAALTPTSAGCASSLASTVCTLTLTIPPSATQYALSVTLLDASGNVLSRSQNVPVTITAGQANSIALSLGGIATGVSVLPYMTHRMTTTSSGSARVYGNHTAQFELLPTDADANIILGPGAPVPTATLASGANAALTAPSSASPNLWTITPNYHASDPTVPANDTLQVSVPPPAASGAATVTSSVSLAIYQPWIYLLDETAGAIDVYDEDGNAIATTVFSGGAITYASYSLSLAYGDGAIYALAGYGHTAYLSRYAPAGGAALQTVTQATSGFSALGNAFYAYGLAFDTHDHQLYTGDSGSDKAAAAFDAELAVGASVATTTSAPTYGAAYIPVTNQIVYNGAYGGSLLCSESLSCTSIGTGLNQLGIAWDPVDNLIGINAANCCGTSGGIQVLDLSGNQRNLVSNGMAGGALAYDPYAAEWFWSENGNCRTPSRCGPIVYDGNGNTVTPSPGFGTYPSNHVIAGIAIVP